LPARLDFRVGNREGRARIGGREIATGVLRRLRVLFRFVAGGLALVVLLLVAAFAWDSLRPPVSTLMLGRWLSGQAVDRRPVPLGAVSPNLVAAVVMSEDGQFCRHHGVDWDSLDAVMHRAGGPSRGASTLTMQTAKNLFLWPGRSYLRKALEIPTALVLDRLWSKRAILQAYLNVAEWGDGVYGAEAAARVHFNKPARDLSRREAALLATALPNPRVRNPARPNRLQRALASVVLARMASADEWLGCLR
jgi:monofunctional glycosyltransferase